MITVPHRTSDSLEDAPPTHRRLPSRLRLRQQYIRHFRTMSEWVRHGYGQKEEVPKCARGQTVHGSTVRCDQIPT